MYKVQIMTDQNEVFTEFYNDPYNPWTRNNWTPEEIRAKWENVPGVKSVNIARI